MQELFNLVLNSPSFFHWHPFVHEDKWLRLVLPNSSSTRGAKFMVGPVGHSARPQSIHRAKVQLKAKLNGGDFRGFLRWAVLCCSAAGGTELKPCFARGFPSVQIQLSIHPDPSILTRASDFASLTFRITSHHTPTRHHLPFHHCTLPFHSSAFASSLLPCTSFCPPPSSTRLVFSTNALFSANL